MTSTGPPLLIEPIDDPDVNEGDTAVLTCRIFSPGKCYYQWFFNNEPLISDPKKYGIKAENDGYTLRIEVLSSADRGFYQCTVANEDGEVTCIGRVNPIGNSKSFYITLKCILQPIIQNTKNYLIILIKVYTILYNIFEQVL